ncbi:MAG TPA: ankyrin repeat domain-containing protein [Methylomirabilota bacterium]|nr:ankyrin repeat domain-containing protein [Methylomirabilota bacterium]
MNGNQKLPTRPRLAQYKRQAKDLLKAFKSGDPDAMRWVRRYHPRLSGRPDTNDRNKVTDSTLRRAKLSIADGQFIIARQHQFENWRRFERHIEELNQEGSWVSQFEAAVDAIVTGDITTLKRLLRGNPEMIRARSTREHRATLLHYVGANAVEAYRQKTPKNAAKVAEVLLKAGAEVDADLDYGPRRKRYPERSGSTTLGLVATSCHPAVAGVQIPLLDILLKYGASVDGIPGGWNPLIAALHNGRGAAAAYLAKRGARLDLEGAAGVGRLDVVKSFFNKDGSLKANATKAQMEAGLMWACEYGRASVVDFLLKQGVDVGAQPHGETGLHWASYAGHAKVVKAFLKSKAPVDIKDKRFGGTPLGWALYGWCAPPPESSHGDYYEVVARLVAAGATVESEWLAESNRGLPIPQKVRADGRMVAALRGEMPRSRNGGAAL